MKKDKLKGLLNEEISKGKKLNSMTTMDSLAKRLWRPHNFRRGIKIKFFDNSMFSKKGFIHDTTIPYEKCLHTKIVTIKFSDNLTIQIFKETIIGEWKQTIIKGKKETVLLKGKSIAEINRKINGAKLHVHNLIESAVNLIIGKVGLITEGDFFYVRGENWTRGDHWIKKLPRDCIVHEEYWKRVYSEEGIEIIGKKEEDSVELFKQHINNSIVYDFSPLIAQEIAINRMLAYDIKAWCESHIKALGDVFKYEDIISKLPEEKRLIASDYLLETFGGVFY